MIELSVDWFLFGSIDIMDENTYTAFVHIGFVNELETLYTAP